MAKKRRKKGSGPSKAEAEKSKNFFFLLGGIGAVLLLIFIGLQYI